MSGRLVLRNRGNVYAAAGTGVAIIANIANQLGANPRMRNQIQRRIINELERQGRNIAEMTYTGVLDNVRWVRDRLSALYDEVVPQTQSDTATTGTFFILQSSTQCLNVI